MKEIKNVTLYKCDFCKKELKRKHAMVNHELSCSQNPINHRACLNFCIHLEQKSIEYDSGRLEYEDGEPIFKDGKAFFCKKHNKFLLHPKVEGEQLLEWVWHKKEEVQQHNMPITCEDFCDDIFKL